MMPFGSRKEETGRYLYGLFVSYLQLYLPGCPESPSAEIQQKASWQPTDSFQIIPQEIIDDASVGSLVASGP